MRIELKLIQFMLKAKRNKSLIKIHRKMSMKENRKMCKARILTL